MFHYYKQNQSSIMGDKISISAAYIKEDRSGLTLSMFLCAELKESQLETVVPRAEPAYVMVICGQHRLQVLLRLACWVKSTSDLIWELVGFKDVGK